MRAYLVAAAGLVAVLATLTHAWEPPKDNKLNESQVKNYIKMQADLYAAIKQYAKDVDAAKSDASKLAIVIGMGDRIKTLFLKDGFSSEGEWDWVRARVEEAWGVAMWDLDVGPLGDVHKKMDEQKKQFDDQLAQAKQSLAEHEAALKAGKKVLTKDEREQIVASAKSDRESALNDVKSASDELAEAKKNNDADAAAAADKKRQEAQANADLAAKRIANPDVPLTEDEKKEAKEQNEQAIASAKEQISQGEQIAAQFSKSINEMRKQHEDEVKKLPPGNLDLVKKHAKEIWDVHTKALEEQKKGE